MGVSNEIFHASRKTEVVKDLLQITAKSHKRRLFKTSGGTPSGPRLLPSSKSNKVLSTAGIVN
jgi:hypothetical protein